jgi:membrane fusion protein (multidrug efflux system)
MQNKRVWSSAWAFALLVSVLLAGCKPPGDDANASNGEKGDDKEKPEEAIAVEVGVATRERIVASYTGTATLEAEREAQVVAKTSGVLLALRAEEGDVVRAGQLLAELDPERTKLELARAHANQKRLENDFARAEELFKNKLISPEQHDKIKFDLETQRAAYELAALELSYTRIVAPIDGVISERLVKEGNLIQLHQALFRIDDFDPLLGVLNVPERELTTLRPGLTVAMAVDALPGRTFEGKVARVSPVVESATGTFRVTTEFHDDTGTLKSGMFGRISIVFAERDNALTIPRSALMDEDGRTAVFVVRDNKVERADVKIGYTSGQRVEIVEGLTDGDAVITVGRAAVREGTKVQVLETAP